MKDQLFYMDDSYIDIDNKYINEAGFVSYITKDIREKERITSLCDDILVKNGFEKKWDDILCIWEYHMTASQCHNNKELFHIIVCEAFQGYTNYPGRNWNIHVDNCDMCSVAGISAETVTHFNKLMKIMDIDFKLNI